MSEKSSTLVNSTAPPNASAKVISIDSMRRLRSLQKQTPSDDEYAYQARILGMDKLALLEEMVRFQQERSERGDLTLEMMSRGRYLFKALEEKAETQELQLLARSYRRHLEHELNEHRRAQAGLAPASED